jgi:hypothetical protein
VTTVVAPQALRGSIGIVGPLRFRESRGGVPVIKRVLQDGWPIEKARGEADAIGPQSSATPAFAVE